MSGRVHHGRPNRSSSQQDVDVPSIFQELPLQPTSTEGGSGASSEEEVQGHQETSTATDLVPVNSEEHGGKRKAKKKHVAKKRKRSKHSNTKDE